MLDLWPAYTDDAGDKTSGTIINSDLLDQIKGAILEDIQSTTNPTLTPAGIADEVKTARGTCLDLNTRLSTVINADGSPAGGSPATQAALQSQLFGFNWAKNAELTRWAGGAAAAPDDWTLSGGGAAVARTGTGEADTFSFLAGKYSLKLTSGGIGAGVLTQTWLADWTEHGNARGRKVVLACKAKAASGNPGTLIIDDGVTTDSVSVTQDNAEHDLVITHVVSASATKLEVRLQVDAGTHSVYFGGFQWGFADVPPTDWQPGSGEATLTSPGHLNATTQEIGGLKKFATLLQFKPGGASTFDAATMGKLYDNWVTVGNVGGGTDDLMSMVVSANVLNGVNRGLRITAAGRFANNANAKQLIFNYGSSTVTLVNSAAAVASACWYVDVLVGWLGASSEVAFVTYRSNLPAANTVTVQRVAPGENNANPTTIKFTAIGVNNDDIQQDMMLVEVI